MNYVYVRVMTIKKLFRPLPSNYQRKDIESGLNKFSEWFYKFEFENGASTRYPDQKTHEIHTTRAEIIFPFLDKMYEGKWQYMDCLDIACNQGWFSSQIAIRGAHRVNGIDIRESHIQMADTIKELSNLTNLNFKVQDFLEINNTSDEKADLVLFLGILYHLDNPLQALRKIRSLTKNLCVIETQVARSNPALECCWGSAPQNRKGPALALIESDQAHVGSNKSLVLVPTLDALYKMLYASGFDHLVLGIPTGTMEEQFQNFDRVVIFAQVDN